MLECSAVANIFSLHLAASFGWEDPNPSVCMFILMRLLAADLRGMRKENGSARFDSRSRKSAKDYLPMSFVILT